MENKESTNNYLLENSTVNDTIPLYDDYMYEDPFDEYSYEDLYDEYRYEDLNVTTKDLKEILDFLNSAVLIFRIVFGLITVTGLVGNILTVAVFLRNKGIKSITDILVLTLAVTDILFIVFGIPRIMIRAFIGEIWRVLTDYVTYSCTYASMYVLVLISLDRYLALVYPIRAMPFRTKKNCYKLIIIIWSMVLLGNMRVLFEFPICSDEEEEEAESCLQIFSLCNFVFEFLLPLLLMCFLYGHILKSFHNANIPGVNTTASRVRLISIQRVTKMVIIAMMVFIVFRLPFHIRLLHIMYVTYDAYAKNIVMFTLLYMVVICMLYLNCCINPILYRSHSKTFRKGLSNVLRCKT